MHEQMYEVYTSWQERDLQLGEGRGGGLQLPKIILQPTRNQRAHQRPKQQEINVRALSAAPCVQH